MAAISDALPCTLNVWVYRNVPPLAAEPLAENQVENSGAAFNCSCAVPRFAPEAAWNVKFACVASRVFVYPSTTTLKAVDEVRTQSTDVSTGGSGAICIFSGLVLGGVTSRPPTLKLGVIVITPATVPVFTRICGGCPEGKSTVRDPFSNWIAGSSGSDPSGVNVSVNLPSSPPGKPGGGATVIFLVLARTTAVP